MKQDMGAGLRISLSTGGTLLAATTLRGGLFASSDVSLKGRLGVAEPDAWRMTLFDGESFHAAGLDVEMEPSWDLELLDILGDLTGHPTESALIVRSSRLLPTDQTLVGRTLTVFHQISPRHSTGYAIAAVTQLEPDRFRIDLHNKPSFLVNRFRVKAVDEKNPRMIELDYWMLKGDNDKGLYTGRHVRLPKQKFSTTILHLPTYISSWHHAHMVVDEVPKDKLEAGDPLVVYEIQPGDRVAIPSHFACQGTPGDSGLKLEIAATGPATLSMPGGYTHAVRMRGEEAKPIDIAVFGDNRWRVQLQAQDVADGRCTLMLTK
ncbi:MAG: hypothetical protein IT440_02615 [Phycisphaeraceae bacterium]|nr:hypothetical protein [Phycisphaeraceae bacterium]